MKKVKFYTSLFIARLISLMIKVLNRSSGTSFVGMFVLKICPDFLNYCSKYILGKKFSITGTNGKTTTAGFFAQILSENDRRVVHNSKGANMLTGIVNLLALNVLPLKRFDNSVFEVDEAYVSKLYDNFKVDYLLVTNLFRDQLDRYGELDTTALKIQSAIDKNPDLTLVLNADDPMVANFNGGKNQIYYGFEKIEVAENISKAPVEMVYCSKCGNSLKYKERFFAQQGHYYCDCGYERPKCKYEASVKVFKDYFEIYINNEYNIHVNMSGLYNAYNALAAIVLALEAGFNQKQIQKAFESYKTVFGRCQKVDILGHEALIQLIKNPTGASEVLKTVDVNSNIIIGINDNYADGRDVSWLWDAEFEYLKNAQKMVVASGIRANDMALRLKYAGVEPSKIKIIPDIKKAIDYVVKNTPNSEKITILPSYTVLLQMKLD